MSAATPTGCDCIAAALAAEEARRAPAEPEPQLHAKRLAELKAALGDAHNARLRDEETLRQRLRDAEDSVKHWSQKYTDVCDELHRCEEWARQQPRWHPIATAPEDTWVLVLLDSGTYLLARHIEGTWLSHAGIIPLSRVGVIPTPTHYMLLPAPPESEDRSRNAQTP